MVADKINRDPTKAPQTFVIQQDRGYDSDEEENEENPGEEFWEAMLMIDGEDTAEEMHEAS